MVILQQLAQFHFVIPFQKVYRELTFDSEQEQIAQLCKKLFTIEDDDLHVISNVNFNFIKIILKQVNMYLKNPSSNMLFRPISKSPRPHSRTDSKSKPTLERISQLKPTQTRRPPSFLTRSRHEHTEPSVVISAPQTAKQVKDVRKDQSTIKLKLPPKNYQNKSATKYQNNVSNQNISSDRNAQKDTFLTVKNILPPKSRKSSDTHFNVENLMEKIQQQQDLIKEIQKIADNKISDSIRKHSLEKHQNGQILKKERSIQMKFSKPILQTHNSYQPKTSIASQPSPNLTQILKKEQHRNHNKNPEQPKTKGRQMPNYIRSPKKWETQTSTSITGFKSIQRPHSYIDILSNSNYEKTNINTANSMIFGENSQNKPNLRQTSTEKKRLVFQQDKFSRNNKSILNLNRLKESPVKQPLSSKKKVSIKDFDLKKKLGEGKFGIVYQAFHLETNTLYAIKKISKEVIKSNLMVDQLLQEIKIQFYCNHENILKIYGFFDDAESIYLILEYMQQGTLFSYFKKQKTLTQQQAAITLRQIASAIVYLQRNGIAHRDIKPQNIVMSNEVGKLCDFGWAAICNDRRKTYCGTFDYVAPEILQGNDYDETVDLWCLGVMAYELMIGKAPFYHISRKQTMKKIMSANLEFPTNLSQNAISFIEGLIRKNPQQRLNGQDIMKHPFLAQKN